MDSFSQWRLAHRALLTKTRELASSKKITLYLVGGAVRDILTGVRKQNLDLDFCLKKHAIAFARSLAQTLGAGFVVLDREHGCARVVVKQDGRTLTLDFSDFRGPTLEEDLRRRDFTVNGMALCLDAAFFTEELSKLLIDPYGGKRDLRDGVIRIACPRSFDEDPLRILRAFSLKAALRFRIEQKTCKLIRAKQALLRKVSAERIRDELFKVFASGNASATLAELDAYRILERIFPELAAMRVFSRTKGRGLDILKHTFATFEHTERVCASFGRDPRVRHYLDCEVSSGRSRQRVLKLAALIHDFGKPKTFRREQGKVSFHGHERLGAAMAAQIAMRLKLSLDEARMLKRIVFLHLRPGYLVTNPVLTARARYRFFRDAQTDAPAILLLALADERATRGYLLLEKIRRRYERVIPRLLHEYFAEEGKGTSPRLVDGHDLMRHFRLEPSPLVGELLRSLSELQALGKIRTASEALVKAAELIKKVPKSRL